MRVLEAAELRALAAEDSRAVGLERDVFVRPGIMSILRFSSGTQKLWMTSPLVTRMFTGCADRDVDLVRRSRRPAPGMRRPRTTAGRSPRR